MSHALEFDRAPQRIYWEVTRACGLACRHCRAEASPLPDPAELTTEEGRAMLDRFAAFGDPKPHVIFTGGDPLERADLFDIIAYAKGLGLHVSVSPSATPRLTPEVIHRFGRAGVEAMSLSIDGATAAQHDDLRGVPGCFERTLAAAKAAAEAKLLVQVNTLVSAETIDQLPDIHKLVVGLGVARWSLFFLVTVGRGTVLESISPERTERLLDWLADLPRGEGYPIVTTTEAPHFRRVMAGKRQLPIHAHGPAGPNGTHSRAGYGIRDGNGIMFVSNTGEVAPSGFLPISAGDVRKTDPVEIYRTSPLFVSLRHASDFHGRCGVCQFRQVCGGSRARAWAASGDPLGEDPLCAYQPEAGHAAAAHA
jgi:radical SAM protein